MSVYHQMGNDSANLIRELSGYAGLIASPVNDTLLDVSAQIDDYQSDSFEVIFDPQLYFPRHQRGKLALWRYFPSDVDTADITSPDWWDDICRGLDECIAPFKPSKICSPALVPKVYSEDYYSTMVATATTLADLVKPKNVGVLQTLIVNMSVLEDKRRVMAISSIASGTRADGVYLVLVSDREPRKEYVEVQELRGTAALIRAIEDAGLPVLVGFCSTDVVLWKHAGASACATGKFFNLRRFTSGRFAEPDKGGSQLPYWIEESLLGFIRESDLVRLRKLRRLSASGLDNPFGQKILQTLDQKKGASWIGLGWRQYMHWFASVERRIAAGSYDVASEIRGAAARWQAMQDEDFFMEERTNDGAWLQSWRGAVGEKAAG